MATAKWTFVFAAKVYKKFFALSTQTNNPNDPDCIQMLRMPYELHLDIFVDSDYYFSFPILSNARSISSGTAKMMVFDWSELTSLIELSVRK